MQIQPYLFFQGRCEEPFDFYRRAIDARVTHLVRFKDVPGSKMCSGTLDENKVMHASLQIGDTTILASDAQGEAKSSFDGFSLSLYAADDGEAHRLFAALSDGGAVQMPLTKTFFASLFGTVKDRFGLSWMVVAGSA